MPETPIAWYAQFGRLPAGHSAVRPALKPRNRSLIGADTDRDAVRQYLATNNLAPQTELAFLRELARWTWFLASQGMARLADADVTEVTHYKAWLTIPGKDHAPSDVGPKAPLFIEDGQYNPDWRPFKAEYEPLAFSTMKTRLAYLQAFYAWLAKGEYAGNPFSLHKNRGRVDGKTHGDTDESAGYRKALSFDALMALFDYLDSDAYKGRQRLRAADRWLIHLLFETGHRAAAAAALTVNHIQHLANGSTALTIVGKRAKTITQVWSSDLHAGLVQYRAAMGLSWPPAPGESKHLWGGVQFEGHPDTALSPTQVLRRVRSVGKAAAAWVAESNPDLLRADQLRMLETMGPHTLRHTCASVRVNLLNETLESVRDHLGHSSVTTTELYENPLPVGESRRDPFEVADRLRSACVRGVETAPVARYGLLRSREVTLFQLAQTWGFADYVDVHSRRFRTERAEQAMAALSSRQRVILGWLGNVWLRESRFRCDITDVAALQPEHRDTIVKWLRDPWWP